MILCALEQPNREVEQLIKEQKDKYYSKYISLSSHFSYLLITASSHNSSTNLIIVIFFSQVMSLVMKMSLIYQP